jgi:hypothetical protein
MKVPSRFIGVLFGAVLFAGHALSQDTSSIRAYVIKEVQDVEFRTSASGEWRKIKLLAELRGGYELRTGEKSFVMLKFGDDSKIAVREKSHILINGRVFDKQILQRDLVISRGRVVFDIKKDEPVVCRILSPISVAILKGGEGQASYEPDLNKATLTAGSGGAEFSSNQMKCSLSIPAGRTGIIDKAGCRRQKK